MSTAALLLAVELSGLLDHAGAADFVTGDVIAAGAELEQGNRHGAAFLVGDKSSNPNILGSARPRRVWFRLLLACVLKNIGQSVRCTLTEKQPNVNRQLKTPHLVKISGEKTCK